MQSIEDRRGVSKTKFWAIIATTEEQSDGGGACQSRSEVSLAHREMGYPGIHLVHLKNFQILT
jgi:hypothetical protein